MIPPFLHVFPFNFLSIFPEGGGQLTPFAPMCGRPCLLVLSVQHAAACVGLESWQKKECRLLSEHNEQVSQLAVQLHEKDLQIQHYETRFQVPRCPPGLMIC